jgi:hypothetical protein
MKLSNLAPAVRHLEVRVGPGDEDVVKVGYRPGALTLEIADKLKELRDDPMADLKVAEVFLLPLLESWDLQDDDGNVLPVTRESFAKLPIEFLGMMFLEIRTDALPNPQMPATSNGGSVQEEREEGSLSGTGS